MGHDRFFADGEFEFVIDGETVDPRDCGIDEFLDEWGVELDAEGYLVDSSTGFRVQATDGQPIRVDEVAIVSPSDDGGVEFVRNTDAAVVDHCTGS